MEGVCVRGGREMEGVRERREGERCLLVGLE